MQLVLIYKGKRRLPSGIRRRKRRKRSHIKKRKEKNGGSSRRQRMEREEAKGEGNGGLGKNSCYRHHSKKFLSWRLVCMYVCRVYIGDGPIIQTQREMEITIACLFLGGDWIG